ncbi:hypothetical protein DPMN_143269 [Dreissena polymorpha]|uniref:Uncharacterized protein n=1 Tax=Dreissena polymorpha TaxID=45954 RepID=A0A9D4JLJ8_DREPO|nr:hypothetical protein DPMN_143269 [Dreissena polymorpha]
MTTVQLPSRSLMNRGLKFDPGLSRTHTDNQVINTCVLGPYTLVSRAFPDAAVFPDSHESTRQFSTSIRINTDLHGGYTVHRPNNPGYDAC